MLRCTQPLEPDTSIRTHTARGASDRDDLALVQRVMVQDEQAFTVLYHRYAPALQRALRRALPQASLVDEVLDDVMLVLWQDARHFPTTVPVGAWLHGIARHQVCRALRRQATSAALAAPPESVPSAVVNPETWLLHHEQEAQLAQGLAAMPPMERLVLEQFLYQGCSYQDIATQTGLPLNTLKAKIARARQRLAQRLSAVHLEAAAAAPSSTKRVVAPPLAATAGPARPTRALKPSCSTTAPRAV